MGRGGCAGRGIVLAASSTMDTASGEHLGTLVDIKFVRESEILAFARRERMEARRTSSITFFSIVPIAFGKLKSSGIANVKGAPLGHQVTNREFSARAISLRQRTHMSCTKSCLTVPRVAFLSRFGMLRVRKRSKTPSNSKM